MNYTEWSDIDTLIDLRLPEGDRLDFKEERTEPEKISKTVTAMTVHGGTILIGIKEAKGNRAGSVVKVDLNGQEEAIRQSVDANVDPTPAFDVRYLIENPADSHGVVVVEVPPSPTAPHYTDGEFPVRHGSTTRTLLESEVEELYRTRRYAAGPGGVKPPPLVDGLFPRLEHATGGGGSHPMTDVASVTVTARMRGEVRHSKDPYLIVPMHTANQASMAWINGHGLRCGFTHTIANQYTNAITTSTGILLSEPDIEATYLKGHLAVVVQFPSVISMRVAVPMNYDGKGERIGGNTVHEATISQEVLGFLHFVGQWFSDFPSQALIDIYFDADGFVDAKSSLLTQFSKDPAIFTSKPSADPSFSSSGVSWAKDLVEDARPMTSSLLERWFFSFLPDEASAARLIVFANSD